MSTVLDTLITDRTSADLAADLDKVYADYICLNRVEQACALLAQRFGVDIKTKEWKMEDYRTDTEMARLLENIKKVRTAYFVKSSAPPTPVKITYDNIYQANDIEQILKDLGDMYDSMISGQRRLSFHLGRKMLGNRR